MTRSSTLARLSAETARTHARVDEALFGPLDFPSSSNYRRFLCVFYGFQAPLENAIQMTPGIDDANVYSNKCGRIASDLMSLGLTRHEHHLLARRQAIPAFVNPAHAIGWLYATERMMLQVEALRIRLENEMPVVTALAHQFLYTYASTAELRWRQFGTLLDRVARAHDVEMIVASARASVEALHAWVLIPESIANVATNDERTTAEMRRISA